MDDSQREIYNRFGEIDFSFDPRKDEMKLITEIGISYVFWIVIGYIMTLPIGARSSRTWIGIVGIFLLSVEVFMTLTETSIPTWMIPTTLTEYELIFLLHSIFPSLIAFLRLLSEYLYVDMDRTSIMVLEDFTAQQKAIKDLLIELQASLESNQERASSHRETQSKMSELQDQIDLTNEATATRILQLKNCSANPGASYYWVLFVLLYGGIYLLQ